MDRDQTGEGPGSLGPPIDPRLVRTLSLAGLGLTWSGVLLSLAGLAAPDSGVLDALRVLVCALGLLITGLAVSFRSTAQVLGLAVLAGVGARFGLPESWDSARLLVAVLTAVSIIGLLLRILPMPLRRAFLCGAVIMHFGGILTAVTGPLYPPYWTTLAWTYVYRPYLQFMYLNNAYHFYSPEPGPANQLWFCATYDKGDQRWLMFPTRPSDIKDPLALSYYRRLSITEQTHSIVSNAQPTAEAFKRRTALAQHIQIHPDPQLANLQFRLPDERIRKLILPSYARQAARMLADPERTLVSVKIYRVLHAIATPEQMVRGRELYEPAQYLPYFQGEFDADGEFVKSDPAKGELRGELDPMLYWLVPIVKAPKNEVEWNLAGRPEFESSYFELKDYLLEHAGSSPFTQNKKGGQR